MSILSTKEKASRGTEIFTHTCVGGKHGVGLTKSHVC